MLHYDGNSLHFRVQDDTSVDAMLKNGGILTSTGASIGDNPSFSFRRQIVIHETHYDRIIPHREA